MFAFDSVARYFILSFATACATPATAFDPLLDLPTFRPLPSEKLFFDVRNGVSQVGAIANVHGQYSKSATKRNRCAQPATPALQLASPSTAN